MRWGNACGKREYLGEVDPFVGLKLDGHSRFDCKLPASHFQKFGDAVSMAYRDVIKFIIAAHVKHTPKLCRVVADWAVHITLQLVGADQFGVFRINFVHA